MRPGRLVVNAAHCLQCNDTVYSRVAAEEWVSCECGNVQVRGGLDFLDRKVETPMKFEELAEWEV